MSVVLELSEEAVKRLQEEASRRRISVEELVGELADSLPAGDPLDAFIGCGESGVAERKDIHTVATLNRRGFTVVQPDHVESFDLIP